MESFNRPRTWTVLGVLGASLFLLYQFWLWEVERVEVKPGEFLVLISLWGKELPSGEIIAPDESYQGIQLKVLPEGRHFINPILYKAEPYKIVAVAPGNCLVLTRKYGNEIDTDRLEQGEILVDGDETPLEWNEKTKSWNGQRGIIRKPLGPGNYYLNPHAFSWVSEPAVKIKTEQVGVRTLKVGKNLEGQERAQRTNPYLVPEGYRGVQEKPVPPGTYYVNPHAERIVPVDVQSITVKFTDLEFPSTDGFTLNPHVIVKFNVQPDMAPNLLVTLTDMGALYQKYATPQDLEKNQILQKVVLPLIRGYVRIEGSKFDARDFIAAQTGPVSQDKVNPREKLQQALNNQVPDKCKDVGITIETITLDKIEPRGELADLANLIAEREQARLKREQNKSLIEQYKSEQELKAKDALTQQKAQTVEAGTLLQNATIEAQKRKAVEEARLKNDLAIAQIRLDAAKDRAKGIVALGKAEAEKIMLENEAEVSGIKKAISGFPSSEAFAQYHIMAKLGPALTEIFASDSSDFAKLFAGYLTGFNPRPSGATAAKDAKPMGTETSGR